ncbi:MAG: CRISPR-associated endonuclease C2c1 [Siphoviridae sp. ctpQM7]|nr:MAG: CRISPR-associated endonuclease C2c1 [Siphoviridae sp. ctpQM7]
MKTFEYRLRPNKQQEQRLFNSLKATRLLYNQALEELIEHYKTTGKHLNRFRHDKMHGKKEHPDLPAVLVDTTIARLHKSFANFFRGIKDGSRIGFPRFKSANQWHSIEFRDAGNYVEGKSFKSGKACAGNIKLILHRPMEGTFRRARIVKRPSGWYLQCVCETKTQPLKKTGKSIGLDFGLRYLIADSNGEIVENDKVGRQNLKKLRRLQRSLARKKKGGKNRRKSARIVARLHERITNRRKDYLHKVSTAYIQKNDRIVLEDLQIKNMVRNHHLAFGIHDASWGMLRNMFAYKAENAGRELIAVAPHYTSQKCSQCGEMVVKSLSVRTHLCPSCGYTADRDVNAAKGILRLGLSLHPLSYAKA